MVDPENPAVGMADLPGVAGKVVFFGAIVFCFFQIITAAFSPLSSIVLRSVHVGFLLFLSFLLFRLRPGDVRRTVPWYDWVLATTAFALGLYHWVFEADLIQRSGQPNTADIVVGSVVVVLVSEASRRIMGWSLPLMCAVFIPYALFGRWLPNFLSHRGFAFEQVIDQLYLGTEGIYGVPTFVSATYIFLFILFGAFLERAGMIRLFNDIALPDSRGDRQHGRPDHAAGDGGRRLHHGRDDRRSLLRDRPGRSRRFSTTPRRSGWCILRWDAATSSACRKRCARTRGAPSPASGICCCR